MDVLTVLTSSERMTHSGMMIKKSLQSMILVVRTPWYKLHIVKYNVYQWSFVPVHVSHFQSLRRLLSKCSSSTQQTGTTGSKVASEESNQDNLISVLLFALTESMRSWQQEDYPSISGSSSPKQTLKDYSIFEVQTACVYMQHFSPMLYLVFNLREYIYIFFILIRDNVAESIFLKLLHRRK